MKDNIIVSQLKEKSESLPDDGPFKEFKKLLKTLKKDSDISNVNLEPNVRSVATFIASQIQTGKLTNSQASDYDQYKKTMIDIVQLLSNTSEDIPVSCAAPLKPSKLRFSDVAGLESTKQEIRKSFVFPIMFENLFKSLSKGVLLYSAPGSGKTLLAKAAVNELENCAFFAPNPGDLKGKYEGETEKNISNVFSCASKYTMSSNYAFSVIFFDEFDAIAKSRSSEDPSTTRTVNSLLQAMDGIASNPRVVILAATNSLPSQLDSAIMRRFNRKIFVPMPDYEARKFIIKKRIAEQFNFPHIKINLDKLQMHFENAINNIIRYSQSTNTSNAELKRLFLTNIDELAQNTGQDLKATIAMGTSSNKDQSTICRGKGCGFSGSDVDKMMDNVFDDVSTETLNLVFNGFADQSGKTVYPSIARYDDWNWSVEDNNDEVDENNYENEIEQKSDLQQSFEYLIVDCKSWVQNKPDISNDDYGKLITFNLKRDQIKTAFNLYQPTISPAEYIKYLNYNQSENNISLETFEPKDAPMVSKAEKLFQSPPDWSISDSGVNTSIAPITRNWSSSSLASIASTQSNSSNNSDGDSDNNSDILSDVE